jgi:hypothetical protein
VVEWLSPEEFLSPQQWKTVHQNTWYQDGGAVREWDLLREPQVAHNSREEKLTVRLYVTSLGVRAARLFFCREAASTTTPEIPYESEVSDEIVTFYLLAPKPDGRTCNDSLLRLYRNVVFQIRAFDAEVNLRAVAAWLQSIAAQNPDAPLTENSPPLMRPEVPDSLAPREEFAVPLPAAPDPFGSFKDRDYQVQVKARGEADFLGFRDQNAAFHLRQSGEGKIQVQAIDQRTLLSKSVGFKVRG